MGTLPSLTKVILDLNRPFSIGLSGYGLRILVHVLLCCVWNRPLYPHYLFCTLVHRGWKSGVNILLNIFVPLCIWIW